MIIVRSPLRITLGGGGTDLPSWYRQHGGMVMSAAIGKYVYITLHETFDEGLIIKYSKTEHVQSVNDVQHPIVREALKAVNWGMANRLEIASHADIPAGTGLGSSSAFTAALLKALSVYHRVNNLSPHRLAELACDIEIERLKEPIGKQDQFITAYGGLARFDFHDNDDVSVIALNVSKETIYNLEDNLMLFFTGYARSASGILKDQDDRTRTKDVDMEAHMATVREIADQSQIALEKGRLRDFAELMDLHWQHKRDRSGGMTNPQIDAWYDLAKQNGAIGGKIVGAGGGGFLMLYAEDKTRLRHAMLSAGLKEIRFRFDFDGTKVIVS